MKNNGLKFFKHSPLFKRLLILSAVAKNSHISQNNLANEVGLTSSMVNNYIRELSKKELIRIKGNTNRTMNYNLTPKGFEEKMSLLVAYSLETTGLYQDAKQEFAQRLQEIYEEGVHNAVLFGAGETAEILYNASKSLDLEIIGIVDNDPDKQGKLFGNLIIQPPEFIERISPDVVIIASVGRQDEIYEQITPLTAKGILIRTISVSNNDIDKD
ncbi:MAG: winged helix-turn-helix transcriptional regulator [Deltaproteobacteria bacterium]|jgi:predicted transcriptional regulator|nr:winged helix-turn-helix transcriptional regulator [Deltaproteobacteria bacterium]